MTELRKIANTFLVSRPVFRLTKHRRDNTISANSNEPVYKYRPQPEEGNALSEIMCENFREHFYPDIGVFTIDTDQIVNNTMSDIRNCMAKFLEKNLAMRNTHLTKIYRWYDRSMPQDVYFNDVIVMVYKYMRTFCDDQMVANNKDHAENAIALLRAIMEKYNDER